VKLAEELAKEQHEGHLKEAEVSSLRQQLEKVQQQLQEGREKWDQKVRDREHGQREEADIIDRLRAQVATLEKGIAELQNKCWEG
jgi:polyhydroxyalkanoate synthesis regulator phasin